MASHSLFRRTLIGAALALGLAPLAQAADAPKPTLSNASGEMLASTCAGCHGTHGASHGPATPTIAGISKAYFTDIMKGFKEDKGNPTIMNRIAKGYDEGEIERMAEYFAAQPFVKAKQQADDKLAADGKKLHDKYCEKCHAEGGSSAADDSGILSGQWKPYLAWSLADFKEGKREAPKKMQKALEDALTKGGDKAVDQLLNYYAAAKK